MVLHWLGDMFDPALAGYWGSSDVDSAMDTALGIIAAHPDKVDGIKISLLDKDKEIAMRRRLPAGVRMYTGDDFNYAELIAGDGFGERAARTARATRCSASSTPSRRPPAPRSASWRRATSRRFHAILGPTVPLSRHIFAAPTRFYKTGVVFMAWLNGHQNHFTMVGGQQSTRSLPHFAELFRLADAANLLEQPELARAAHEHAAGAARRRGLSRMRDFSQDHRWLSINTATVRKQPRRGPAADSTSSTPARSAASAPISPWRDQVAAAGLPAHLDAASKTHGLELSGYCRGGMFPAPTPPACQAARDDNRRAVDEACELNAPCLVLVVGALPGALAGKAAHKDIALVARAGQRRHRRTARRCAQAAGMPLAIEPLHPMYAADRACINTHGAGARRLRRARPRAQRRARRGGRRLPRVVGPEAAGADRTRRQASACWPSTSATG